MADEVTIDKHQFHTRLSSFIAQWKADRRGGGGGSGSHVFGDVGSIVVVMGKSEQTDGFHKANALQFWLLGYEFPTTLFLFTLEAVYIVTTKKKAAYLEVLKDGGKTPVEILVRGKDADENAAQLARCVDIIKRSNKKVGVLTNGKGAGTNNPSAGAFVTEWKAALSAGSKEEKIEEFEIDLALSQVMAVKDEAELRAINNASRASALVMQDYFIDEMSDILDRGRKITHRDLAEKIANKIDDAKFFKQPRFKMAQNFDPLQLDWNVSPTIMSGGSFDLKFVAQPDNENLHAGVIIAALGLRYGTYASVLARTYLVDPTKAQENLYKLLLNVHETVVKEMRDGVIAKDVYAKALAVVKARKPELEKHFVKTIAAGIGLEGRDSGLVVNAKSTRVLRDGMTFAITTGFSGVENPEPHDKKRDAEYALVLTDTVRIGSSSTDAFVFTKHAASDAEATMFFFNDSEEEKEAAAKKDSDKAKARATATKREPRVGVVTTSNITKTRLRGQGGQTQNEEKEAARREHQKELHAKKQKEGEEKYGEGHGNLSGGPQKKFKRFESYKYDTQFPARVKDLMILVDPKNGSVVLPIMGRPVPFHINTLKNAVTSEENNFCYLRINFLSPGQGVGRKDDQPFEDPTAQFIRSLTFRSKDTARMESIRDQITEMKKEAIRKEQEKKDMEDVVEQDKLIEVRNRRPHRLENVYMRPAMESKRVAGSVEIHQNGLRYIHHAAAAASSNQKIDILFANVKHLFFQPCVGELIVIIHVHLLNPIMMGKKKTRDVQFYREATEMQFDETGTRKRKHRYGGDEEEFEAEQEEKRRRAQLDREFRNFAEKIADASKGGDSSSGNSSSMFSVDMPFRDLGFNGVPSRSSVMVQPTTDCLVQLTEPPFTVITLTDIEVVHLERVQFGLKNFDMVIVFKDFTRSPAHINTIPVESLDAVKDWLDSVDIPYSEGPLNLNWGTIMKTVVQDPHTFFRDGGWSFLSTDDDEDDEDEEDEESAFEVEEGDLASDESSEDEEDESEFDDDADASDDGDDGDDDEEEGEDWDELEIKARKKDRESGLDGGRGGGKGRKR